MIRDTNLRYFLRKQGISPNFVKNPKLMENKKRTEIAELGEFGLIDRLTRAFGKGNPSTVAGVATTRP